MTQSYTQNLVASRFVFSINKRIIIQILLGRPKNIYIKNIKSLRKIWTQTKKVKTTQRMRKAKLTPVDVTEAQGEEGEGGCTPCRESSPASMTP